MRARPLALGCLAVAACSLAACGAERHSVPAATVRADSPRAHFAYRPVGLEIDLPAVAPGDPRKAPGVFRSSLGESFIAGFAYRRAEQLPRNAQELEAARRRLVAQIQKRDRRFHLLRSRPTRAAGAQAVEVVGDQRIAGATLRTRSLHVYKGSGEYVLDMLSPVREFPGMDRTYFTPAVRSLKLTGKVAGSGRT